ncbi:DUF3483 domain-containing protein [Mesorhizobium sp. CO1-1-8]|uniref:DUF3483 domain-containing protein n=1 Tax=Mesorhizobium sp. CO1-1-8 TaxID=2876631 RepID=UPI001CD18430|nr:DUF3483 domain-containing protein [Mesorhizobium sp. CO1-1-8]MBZ9775029.1 (Fe-S)-binding protein [Mesorhizobium sp. CO1-1-8]
MTEPTTAMLCVLAFAASVALARFAMLALRWRVGMRAEVPILAGIASLPGRYLHDVHAVVARKPESARMHASLAGGILLALVLATVLGIHGGRILGWLVLGMCAIAAYGLLLQARRRLPNRPAHLSGGKWSFLTFAFALVLGSIALATAAVLFGPSTASDIATIASLGCGLMGLGWLAWTITDGPMRHAVAGAAHLAFHPRPDRFGASKPSSALRTIDLDAPVLGAPTVGSFSWNRLAGFDSCVQCGRCETACPAFAAGMPLNPKRLVQDIAGNLASRGARLSYSGSPHPHIDSASVAAGPSAPLVSHIDSREFLAMAPETLWACTTCRACVQECPMMIEHVDAVIDIRRYQTLEEGAAPGKAAEVLDNLDKTDTASGRALSERLDWAADLSLPLISPGQEVDALLWLGEAAYDRRNQRTLRALVLLLRQAKVDFAVLEEERDCGDLARRLGDEAGFIRLARSNVEMLSELRFKRIVTTDPHVLHSLRNEYAEFGAALVVEHHTQILNRLVEEGRLTPARLEGRRVTYHDPCYLGRYNGETAAPRALLSTISTDFVEMERSGMRSRCCGGGGGAPVTDISGDRRIPDIRMEDAKSAGADIVITACPYCAQMLEGVSQARLEVIDIAELLLASTGASR